MNKVLNREIYSSVVFEKNKNKIRCIYVNDHRIVGDKPYVSENLPFIDKNTTVGKVLKAFSIEELQSAINDKINTNYEKL